MKNSNFEFDHLPNSEDLKSIILDENDPRSTAYIRRINRPKINWKKIALTIIIPIVSFWPFVIIFTKIGLTKRTAVILFICFLLIYCSLLLKKGIVTLIRLYQRFAPEALRNKCRFEPSCSEYMILSIEKNGLFKGVFNGIKRLKRCNINGGGYDYP